MKELMLLLSLMAGVHLSFGQIIQNSAIGSTGNSSTIDNYIVDWTVGEIAIEKITNSDCIVTQGLHQSFLMVTAIVELPASEFKVTCYPNPTHENVNVKIETHYPESLFSIAVTDLNGKVFVSKESIRSSLETVKLSSLPNAVFLLTVTELKSKKTQIFKIIKQPKH